MKKCLIAFMVSILCLCACTKKEASESSVKMIETPIEMVFSSGAGGWSTVLTLNPDGSFTGQFNDSEMGEVGDGYPKGSVYMSEFSGNFGEIEKIDDTSYSLVLDEMKMNKEENEEWVEDEIRYVASIPYGLEEGKNFVLYLVDTPVEGLNEEFLSWWPLRFEEEANRPDTLSFYGLYNVDMGYGFFGK